MEGLFRGQKGRIGWHERRWDGEVFFLGGTKAEDDGGGVCQRYMEGR